MEKAYFALSSAICYLLFVICYFLASSPANITPRYVL
jgi:hypothetical protein